MSHRRWIACLAIGIICTLVVSAAAYAQRTTGDITGTIMDATGAVLPGAAVTAVCTDTNLTRTVVSDAQGGSGRSSQIRVRFVIQRQIVIAGVTLKIGPATGTPIAKDEIRARLREPFDGVSARDRIRTCR